MKIKKFEHNSQAAEMGFKIGDDLTKINDYPIRDIIDFRYHVSDDELNIEIIRDRQQVTLEIEKEYDDDLGIIFENDKYRHCNNKCIFCFIDQNPYGLRNSLYFKDEDYRLSFLYGNYVTLTNTKQKDLNRIVEQRLSPLYISVHSTDLAIRKLLFGIKKDDHLLDKIQFLTDHQIKLHVQIVLCPLINDGNSLLQTVKDLAKFYPLLKSIAIVPVGLTKHRQNLYPINPVTPNYSRKLIPLIETLAQNFKTLHDDYIVYLADEFYLLAKQDLPATFRYEKFPQIENGVGMARQFIDKFHAQKQNLPQRVSHNHTITLVTGVLAAPILEEFVKCKSKKKTQIIAEWVFKERKVRN